LTPIKRQFRGASGLALLIAASLLGAWLIRGVRQVPPPASATSADPLTDQAPRRYGQRPQGATTTPTAENAQTTATAGPQPTAAPPPTVLPTTMDLVQPPQGTQTMAGPGPIEPPDPWTKPALSVDPWAQRRKAAASP